MTFPLGDQVRLLRKETPISRRYFRRKESHKEAPGAWVMVGEGMLGWITDYISKGSKDRLERGCVKVLNVRLNSFFLYSINKGEMLKVVCLKASR